MGFLIERIKYLRILPLIVVAIIFFFIKKTNTISLSESKEKIKNIYEETEYYGYVTLKKSVPENHNWYFIIINNSSEINVPEYFYQKIKIGDSVSKRKNDFFLTVYRGDKNFVLDFDKFY